MPSITHASMGRVCALLPMLVLLAGLYGCGEGLNLNKGGTTTQGPVANAGSNQAVFTGATVTLNGSGSVDPSGGTLTYAWTLSTVPSGSTAQLSSGTAVKPSFVPDLAGNYVASLTVSDANGTSSPATVTIFVAQNHAPVANAGSNKSALTGYTVTLNGGASADPDGTAITYAWNLTSVPSGSAASLSSSSNSSTSFLADLAGSYVVSLTVSDGLLSSTTSVTVTVTPNQAPVANPGANQGVATGSTVTLNGTGSSDPDGTTVTYAWTLTAKPTGSTAALSSSTAAKPQFKADLTGTYTASLVVSDGVLTSTAATVTVTAEVGPSANAGPDQNGTVGALVTLDGTASTAPSGNPLTYLWGIVGPSGSTATLSSNTVAQPTFTPDVDGTYIISLVVSDGVLASTADNMTVSTVWFLNTTGATAPVITDSGGNPIQVNVQSVDLTAASSKIYYNVVYSGMPDYVHTITAADMAFLGSRPNAATDFRAPTNATTVTLNQVVDWGADINYNSSNTQNNNCYTNQGGLGWWPPGPGCPDNTNTTYTAKIPFTPVAATSTCYTAVNSDGLYRNGVPIFNWSDSESYNSQKTWHNIAATFEQYDVDLCQGHAQQQGVYHHHALPVCLTEELNQKGITDDGTVQSPIYGYAADGYPIYGQYEKISGTVVRVQSCWAKRDYDTPDPVTGCGTAHKRTCVLKDNTNPSAGNTTVTNAGPDTTATTTTQSGNTINAVSGVYYEDYYFDSTCAVQGNQYLDQHNGHDLGDGRGYHYHFTTDPTDPTATTPAFPFNIGPTFKGKLDSNTIVSTCNSSPAPNF